MTSKAHPMVAVQNASFAPANQMTHNLISFDARGVNISGPSLSCFPDDLGIVSLTDSLVSGGAIASQSDTDVYYRAQALAERCNLVLGGPSGLAKYASTPAVAYDMLTFIEAEARDSDQDPEQAQHGRTQLFSISVYEYGYTI